MGQCVGKEHGPGDPPLRLASASVCRQSLEATAYHLRNKSGAISTDERAVDEVLGPLLQLVMEARFGYNVCQHVFKAMSRVARRGLADKPEGVPSGAQLARLQEVAWGVEELLASFSSRGWLLRLLRTSRLDVLVRWRLDDIAALAEELTPRDIAVAEDQDETAADEGPDGDSSKELAAGLRSVRRLREALSTHIPSVMAPYGAAGDPAAMDAFLRRITPLVQDGEDPVRQLELQEEVQIAVAAMSVGPHRALRHPDLQLFWWRHLAGLEEVPWSTLWPHLATFLANTPRLSEGAGDIRAALTILKSPELVRVLQSAVHRMGYANYVNAVELDMAFCALTSGGITLTLDEQLRVLTTPGRPVLTGRTSKGARADGWAKEAEAAAAAAAAADHLAEEEEGTAERKALGTATAPGLEREAAFYISKGDDDGEEWFDAGSNFSRASSSAMFATAGGEEVKRSLTGRRLEGRSTTHASALSSVEEGQATANTPAAPPSARSQATSAELLTCQSCGAPIQAGAQTRQDEPISSPAEPQAAAPSRQACQEASAGDERRETAAMPDGMSTPAPAGARRVPSIRPVRTDIAPGLSRLVGRDDELSNLVGAVIAGATQSATLAGISATQQQPATTPAPIIVLSGPRGCGKTALATAASNRLVASGTWAGVALADLRCAAGPEEAALLMALALNVPFYAADRPGGARLLSWLRTHGSQLQQGLILDNADLLLGVGQDDALEAARSGPGSSGGAAGDAATRASTRRTSTNSSSTEATVEDRRRRALRLLRDIAVAAPGLRLVLVTGPAVNWDLLQPVIPQGLSFTHQALGSLALQDATQLLRNTLSPRVEGCDEASGAAGQAREEQLIRIAEACDRLPGLLRLAGAGVRSGAADLTMMATAATEALRRAYEMGMPEAAAAGAFAAHLISHSVMHLPAQARAVLCCMSSVGCPLEEEDVAAAVGLGDPCAVRAGLCCLYDRGLLSYQDLSQRHEVVGHVRIWILRCNASLVAPVVHGGPSFTSTAAMAAALSLGRSMRTPRRSTSGGGRGVARNMSTPGAFSDSTAASTVAATPQSTHSRVANGGTVSIRETGVRLRALVEHLDGLMSQAGELYASGCRVSALRFYNNGRVLADRGLLLLPAWLQQAGPATATAAVFAAVMTRHLNGICRHVLLPGQLARAARELAVLLPSLPSPHDRLTGHVAAARTLAHLLSLRAATKQLAAADTLARKLYPALAGAVQAAEAMAQAHPQQSPAPPPPGEQRRAQSTGGGSSSELVGLPAQVVLLSLAHAEVAAAGRRYNAAAHHLACFLDLLSAVGLSGSLEGAQARMQLGDLTLRLGRPPAEAAAQYEAAASILTQLYGQSHFRVGRAMLAAARCGAEAGAGAASAVVSPARSLILSELGSSCTVTPRFTEGATFSQRPLDVMLKDCLYVQQLSQGKFNLDVAEVEVARGALLCQRNRPDEALSCGLVALGIVLEVLGDGTPQVGECLDLVSAALRQQRRPAAAAAIALHAQAIREHVATSSKASDDEGEGPVNRLPLPPTEAVVLEHLHVKPEAVIPPSPEPAAAQASTPRPTSNGSLARVSSGRPPLPRPPSTSSGCSTPAMQQSGSILVKSPIVQVPIPSGDAATATISTTTTSLADSDSVPREWLMPSPDLVLLAPGGVSEPGSPTVVCRAVPEAVTEKPMNATATDSVAESVGECILGAAGDVPIKPTDVPSVDIIAAPETEPAEFECSADGVAEAATEPIGTTPITEAAIQPTADVNMATVTEAATQPTDSGNMVTATEAATQPTDDANMAAATGAATVSMEPKGPDAGGSLVIAAAAVVRTIHHASPSRPPPLTPQSSIPHGVSCPSPPPLPSPPPTATATGAGTDGSLAAAAAAVLRAVRQVSRSSHEGVPHRYGALSPRVSPGPSPATTLESPLPGGPSPPACESRPAPAPTPVGQPDAFTPVREIPLRTFFSAAEVRRSLQDQSQRSSCASQEQRSSCASQGQQSSCASQEVSATEVAEPAVDQVADEPAEQPHGLAPPASEAGLPGFLSSDGDALFASASEAGTVNLDDAQEVQALNLEVVPPGEPKAGVVDLIAAGVPILPDEPETPTRVRAADARAPGGCIFDAALAIFVDSPSASAGGANSSQHASPNIHLPPPPPDSLARAAILAAASRAATPRDPDEASSTAEPAVQQSVMYPTEEESFASNTGITSSGVTGASSTGQTAASSTAVAPGRFEDAEVASSSRRPAKRRSSRALAAAGSVVDPEGAYVGQMAGAAASGAVQACDEPVAAASSPPESSGSVGTAASQAVPVGSRARNTSVAVSQSTPGGLPQSQTTSAADEAHRSVESAIAASELPRCYGGADVACSSASPNEVAYSTISVSEVKPWTGGEAGAVPASSAENAAWDSGGNETGSDVLEISSESDTDAARARALILTIKIAESVGAPALSTFSVSEVTKQQASALAVQAQTQTESEVPEPLESTAAIQHMSPVRATSSQSEAVTPNSRPRRQRASYSGEPTAFGTSSPSRIPPPRSASGSTITARRRSSATSLTFGQPAALERTTTATAPKVPASSKSSSAISSPGLRRARDGAAPAASNLVSPLTRLRAPLPPTNSKTPATAPPQRPSSRTAGRSDLLETPTVVSRTRSRSSRASSDGTARAPRSASSSRIPTAPGRSSVPGARTPSPAPATSRNLAAVSAPTPGSRNMPSQRPASSRIPAAPRPPQLSRETSTLSSLNFDSDIASVRGSADSMLGLARRGSATAGGRDRTVFYPHDTGIRGADQSQSVRASSEGSVLSELTSPTLSRLSSQIPGPPLSVSGPQQRSISSRIPSLTERRNSIEFAEGELAEGALAEARVAAGAPAEGKLNIRNAAAVTAAEGVIAESMLAEGKSPARAVAAASDGPSPTTPGPSSSTQSLTPSSNRRGVGATRIPQPPSGTPSATPPARCSGIPLAPNANSPFTPVAGNAAQRQLAAAAESRGSGLPQPSSRRRPSPFTSLPSPREAPDLVGPGTGTPNFLDESAVSSPAARKAGSYTAAFLMQTGATPPSVTAPGSRRGSLLPQVGAGCASNGPTVPRGVKLHNPLFIGNSPRLADVNYHDEENQQTGDSAGRISSEQSLLSGFELPMEP